MLRGGAFDRRQTMMRRATAVLVLWTMAFPALAQLEQISNRDAVAGLKAALDKGAVYAVQTLGRTNGFFGDPRVKIPLPQSLQTAERLMRSLGMGGTADELILAMNRAAEAAVPEAKKLLVDSVKKMTVQDAKGILTGGDTAGTEYFRRTTQDQLRARFLPIVKRSTAKVGLAQTYNQYAGEAARFGLVKKEQANIDVYVTGKALDGLYFMIAEEEKKIRRDPVGAASGIISKVFGAIR
jgi:hypothetical protein